MKILLSIFLGLSLVACGGGSSNSQTSNVIFSQEELANTILISKEVLEFGPLVEGDIGSIVLFSSTKMREFSLSVEQFFFGLDGVAEYADLPYTVLSNGQIEIMYPQNVTCLTTKKTETSTEIEISSACTNNLQLTDTYIKPLPFDSSELQGRKITTRIETSEETFDFGDDNFLEFSTPYARGQGTFLQSVYKNTVRVNLPGFQQYDGYSLFFLVKGDLSSGIVGEIRYNANEDIDIVRFYIVSGNNKWDEVGYYF